MSDTHITDLTHAAPHAVHGPALQMPFSETEVAMLHRQDISAGRAVVTLMCSIFLLGVFIYSIVAATVVF